MNDNKVETDKLFSDIAQLATVQNHFQTKYDSTMIY